MCFETSDSNFFFLGLALDGFAGDSDNDDDDGDIC